MDKHNIMLACSKEIVSYNVDINGAGMNVHFGEIFGT